MDTPASLLPSCLAAAGGGGVAALFNCPVGGAAGLRGGGGPKGCLPGWYVCDERGLKGGGAGPVEEGKWSESHSSLAALCHVI